MSYGSLSAQAIRSRNGEGGVTPHYLEPGVRSDSICRKVARNKLRQARRIQTLHRDTLDRSPSIGPRQAGADELEKTHHDY